MANHLLPGKGCDASSVCFPKSCSFSLLQTTLEQVLVAMLLGIVIGCVAGFIYNFCRRRRWADKEFGLVYVVALSLAALGGMDLLGGDGIVTAFFAGIGFNFFDSESDRREEKKIDEAIDALLAFFFFGAFGILLPWSSFTRIGVGKLIGLSLLILILRRFVGLLVLKPVILGRNRTWSDAAIIAFIGLSGSEQSTGACTQSTKLTNMACIHRSHYSTLYRSQRSAKYCFTASAHRLSCTASQL